MKKRVLVFSLGQEIFAWNYNSEGAKPEFVVKRPEAVTCIRHFYHKGEEMLIDSCQDGKIRRLDNNEVLFECDEPIACFADQYQLGSRARRDQNFPKVRLTEEELKEMIVVLTAEEHQIFFRSFTDGNIFHQEKRKYTHLPFCTSDSFSFFWAECGAIYRGFTRAVTDRSVIDEAPKIIDCSMGYWLCEYTNQSTHPQGVTVSTRDKHPFACFSPEEYGYPRISGSFGGDGEELQFFFVNHLNDEFVAYTRPVTLRSNQTQALNEVWRIDQLPSRETTGPTNPFVSF